MSDDLAARDLEDARLIETGEHDRLLAKYIPAIERRVRMDLRGPDAEDVVSQVVLHLWTELRRGKRFKAPFRVVAVKRAGWMVAEYLRGKRLVPVGDEEWDERVYPDELDDWQYVRSVLDDLPARDREVFELSVYGGLSPNEVASRLGITRNAVDQAMHRAREKLRALIDG